MGTVISVENLSVSYGNIGALSDVSFKVEKGEFLGIIGPNGGGKTTLLSTLLGLITPEKGSFKVFDNNIGYVPQTVSVDRLFPITVKEAVLTAFLNKRLNPFKKFTLKQKEQAINSLKDVMLSHKADNLISELSGGEFQRMLIARALVNNPDILLLDEPTSNIDTASTEEIYNLLIKLNQKGKTIIMVTHDLQRISSLFSRILFVNQTVLYSGAPQGFFKGETKND